MGTVNTILLKVILLKYQLGYLNSTTTTRLKDIHC